MVALRSFIYSFIQSLGIGCPSSLIYRVEIQKGGKVDVRGKNTEKLKGEDDGEQLRI